MQLNKKVPVVHVTEKSNKILDFTQVDSEDNFNLTKEKLGKDWYYYDKDIEYKYNSWGYRSKEFSDLNDDYILVFGCSFTEGIGLHYDDMWSTKLAKSLNMDVFNLSIGGSGPDVVLYNTILFHNLVLKSGKLPKYVIYQWTFENRTSYMFYHEDNLINLETFSASYPKEAYPENYKKYIDWYNEGFLVNEGELIKQSNVSTLVSHNLWKTIGIPVYHWTWKNDFNMKKFELFHNSVEVDQIEDCFEIKGRDGSHNGHLSQNIVVNKILEKIRNGFS
jgi:hypothetical protein